MLEIESRSVKALYRRAQACIQLGDLDLAELDIKKALEIDPDNRWGENISSGFLNWSSFFFFFFWRFLIINFRDVKLEYKVLKEKVREYNKRDAKFYGNMFAKLSKLEPTEVNVRRHHPTAISLLDALLLYQLPHWSFFSFCWLQKTGSKQATEPMSIDSAAWGFSWLIFKSTVSSFLFFFPCNVVVLVCSDPEVSFCFWCLTSLLMFKQHLCYWQSDNNVSVFKAMVSKLGQYIAFSFFFFSS